MSQLNLDSPFISYTLTEEERLSGSILQESQRQVIQNMLHQAACKKLNLTWTPDNMQQEAELQGEIKTLQSILDNHTLALEYFKTQVVADKEEYANPTTIFSGPMTTHSPQPNQE